MNEKSSESLLGAFRVLDLTEEKGLMCGKILGDLGADVIKIEMPGGDAARQRGPFYKDDIHPEKSLYWIYTNLNKKSITLDIQKDEGREIFRRLVRTADFLIESFDPGYMAGPGLGYEDLEMINPRIIMTSITPYGQTGPRKDYIHSDMTAWATGGMMRLCGDPDRPPVRVCHQANLLGGLHGALGSMVAHYFREMSGEGQHVDVSIQQAVMLSLMISSEYWDVLQINISRSGSSIPFPRKHLPPLVMPQCLPCKDGYVALSFSVGASGVNKQSNAALLEMMHEDGMGEDLSADYLSTLSFTTVDQEEYNALRAPIDQWMLTKTKAELYEAAIQKSILLAPVNNVEDIAKDRQLKDRNFWVEVWHPELRDHITYPGAPVKLSECPWEVRRRPPYRRAQRGNLHGGTRLQPGAACCVEGERDPIDGKLGVEACHGGDQGGRFFLGWGRAYRGQGFGRTRGHGGPGGIPQDSGLLADGVSF